MVIRQQKMALPNFGNQKRKAGFVKAKAKIGSSCLKSKGNTKTGVSPMKRRENIAVSVTE